MRIIIALRSYNLADSEIFDVYIVLIGVPRGAFTRLLLIDPSLTHANDNSGALYRPLQFAFGLLEIIRGSVGQVILFVTELMHDPDFNVLPSILHADTLMINGGYLFWSDTRFN